MCGSLGASQCDLVFPIKYARSRNGHPSTSNGKSKPITISLEGGANVLLTPERHAYQSNMVNPEIVIAHLKLRRAQMIRSGRMKPRQRTTVVAL